MIVSISGFMDTIGVLCRQAGTSAMGTMLRARRSWSAEEKRRIVEESLRPGASASVVARRHDINANLLFNWRRHARVVEPAAAPPPAVAPEPVEFVPIGVFGRAEDEGPAMLATAVPRIGTRVSEVRSSASRSVMAERPGVIEVELPDGVRVRIDAFVNERALRRVFQVLKGLG